MIELKKADFAKEGKKIKALYIRAFPREERPPFFLIRKRAEQGRAECWSLYDGKAWAGFAYVLREGGLAYLFLLAIDEAKRGQGLGTQTIGTLLRQYDGCRFSWLWRKWTRRPRTTNSARSAMISIFTAA